MPTYDFFCTQSDAKCPRKSDTFEASLSIADRDAPARVHCPDCGAAAKRIVVPLKAPMCVIMKGQETSNKQIPERLLP